MTTETAARALRRAIGSSSRTDIRIHRPATAGHPALYGAPRVQGNACASASGRERLRRDGSDRTWTGRPRSARASAIRDASVVASGDVAFPAAKRQQEIHVLV